MLRTIALLALFYCVSARALDFPLSCTYVANTPTAELEPHAKCAARAGMSLRIASEHLARMSYTTYGLAVAGIDGSWRYVKPNGESLPVVTNDNGADYFSEGLTRSLVRGKIAYYNRRFRQVIAPKYEWGWPFDNGRALVCRGCQLGGKPTDEYRFFDGGLWGFIDRNGHEVVPVNLTRSEAEALDRYNGESRSPVEK